MYLKSHLNLKHESRHYLVIQAALKNSVIGVNEDKIRMSIKQKQCIYIDYYDYKLSTKSTRELKEI